MDKRLKVPIVLIAVFLIIGIGVFFFLQYCEDIPQVTDNKRINKILFDHAQDLVRSLPPPGLNEDSLVNLVHIVKKDSDYEISCQFGPSYETANLFKFLPQELVSMGQIKSCDVETARAIDKAINSSEMDCRVFISSEIVPPLTDYYLLTLALGEREITQEWLDRNQGKKCPQLLENLKGERIATLMTAIIDLKENIIYF